MAKLEDDDVKLIVLVVEVSSGYHTKIDLIVTADVNRHLEVGLDMKWTILDLTREQMQMHYWIL